MDSNCVFLFLWMTKPIDSHNASATAIHRRVRTEIVLATPIEIPIVFTIMFERAISLTPKPAGKNTSRKPINQETQKEKVAATSEGVADDGLNSPTRIKVKAP